MYIGEWAEDSRNGQGKMIFADGEEQEGFWVNDQF